MNDTVREEGRRADGDLLRLARAMSWDFWIKMHWERLTEIAWGWQMGTSNTTSLGSNMLGEVNRDLLGPPDSYFEGNKLRLFDGNEVFNAAFSSSGKSDEKKVDRLRGCPESLGCMVTQRERLTGTCWVLQMGTSKAICCGSLMAT